MSHNFCPAEPKDGERILKILECSPAKGSIELLYTRRPDAYLSYQKESDEAFVYVAKEDERIVGTVAEITRQVYIGEKKKKAAYICGLKKDIDFPGAVNFGRAFFHSLVKEDVDSYFCSVISDNFAIRNIFEKRRKKTANTESLGRYTTYMLAPYFHFKTEDRGYVFKHADKTDESRIIDFLNTEGCKKDFFPVIESLEQFTDLGVENFYILQNDEGIVAVGALWNQSGYRQYIVKKYKGIMKLVRCLNPILSLLGYIKLPKENENIDFSMLSFFLAKDDNEDYYKTFLNNIAREIKKNCGMFVIGTTETYFADRIYKKMKNFHFDTEIYSVEFILGGGKKAKIDKSKLWFECGLL